MDNNLGMGVMIRMLGGNADTVNALTLSKGKKIIALGIEDNRLWFTFDDGAKMQVWDGGQSCCESRWMEAQADLKHFVGGQLVSIEEREAASTEGDYEVREQTFLWVTTTRGVFVVANYNEHNGYYGGFYIEAQYTPATEVPTQ